jgi:hypothetical protein
MLADVAGILMVNEEHGCLASGIPLDLEAQNLKLKGREDVMKVSCGNSETFVFHLTPGWRI